MTMVGGLDLHREQITFDAAVLESGEVWRGRIRGADRERFRRWLLEEVVPRAGTGRVAFAVEGCTGWRYVTEEITAAGFEAHLAEPADTQAARGRKRRAKTDRSDAALLRVLLEDGELPESWIPPTVVLERRELVRVYKTLIDQRSQWSQRIHAELYQQGAPALGGGVRTEAARAAVAAAELSPAGRRRVEIAYAMIESTDAQVQPLKADLVAFGRRQPACQALAEANFGISALLAVVIWTELGDCRRFSRSRQAVRHAGLDVSVDASDRRRANGHLTRQGPQILRWALFEAAQCACRPTSPDRDYYTQVRDRHNAKIAALSVARLLARRCYHQLRALEPELVYAPSG
jgi:transposase